MNKIRRKQLQEISDKLHELTDDLESVMSEEEECRDNMPENLWESERYEKMDEACDNLSSALDSLNEAVEYIEETIDL